MYNVPHIFTCNKSGNEPYVSAKESCKSAKEPCLIYMNIKEPCVIYKSLINRVLQIMHIFAYNKSAKEPYVSAKESYNSATEPCIIYM